MGAKILGETSACPRHPDVLRSRHSWGKWYCSECQKERNARRRAIPGIRERDKQKNAQWRTENKEKIRQKNIQRWANPELREKERQRGAEYRAIPENKRRYKQLWDHWYDENKEKHKQRRLERIYNITSEEKEAMWLSQDKRCRICRDPINLWSMHPGDQAAAYVDHDHGPENRVRGLLCNSCNTAIGKLKESVEILRSAIGYLGGDPCR